MRFDLSKVRLSAAMISFAVMASFIEPSASAGFVTLFNTGVDSSGKQLAPGSTDPHWMVFSGPGITTPQAAVVVSDQVTGVPYAQTSDSRWIWENSAGSGENTTYDFRLTFNLTGINPNNAVITGLWGTDNSGYIALNGATSNIGTGALTNTSFTSLSSFTLNKGFVNGTNTLDFVVKNVDGPGALNVSRLVGGSVPEPASVVMMGMGLLLFGGVTMLKCRGSRRHKTGLPSLAAALAFLTFSAVSNPCSADIVITNSGFETPNLGSNFQYNPTGSGVGWTFPSGGAGIAANGSGFGVGGPGSGDAGSGAPAPQGTQVGFLQGTGSSITQSLSGFAVGGTYNVHFLSAQRPTANSSFDPLNLFPQTIQVMLDSKSLGYFTPSSTNYTSFVSGPFTITDSLSHTLKFLGTNSAYVAAGSPTGQSDNTAFIDRVSVAPVPEPASVLLFTAGLAVIAYSRRLRSMAWPKGIGQASSQVDPTFEYRSLPSPSPEHE